MIFQLGNAQRNIAMFSLNNTHTSSNLPNPYAVQPHKIVSTVFQAAVPVLGITYGVIALNPSPLREWNFQTRERVLTRHTGFHTRVDDYIQYAPGVSVLALKLSGVKGEYPFWESVSTFAFNSVLLLGATQITKYTVKEMRPDNSSRNSFPSGHTATSFAFAEWLRTEYWQTSPWIGVSGYLVASTVGVLRVFNNRHWVSDVVCGAAIGFLCTRIAYWLKPYVIDPMFRGKKKGVDLDTPPIIYEHSF